jgi:hypothetical protein
MRWLSISVLSLFMLVTRSLGAEEIALFTVDVKLAGTGVAELVVNIRCDSDRPVSFDYAIPVDSSKTFTVPAPENAGMSCSLTTRQLIGHQLGFLGDGGSDFEADAPGCTFSNVRRGHSNFCQIRVEDQETSLTVFKRWIGTSRKEADSRVSLDCGNEVAYSNRKINSGKPGAWTLTVDESDGFLCSVSEEEGDGFIADTSDCQGLLVMPGAVEECTIVNTKVVKMIEVFNRYGLAVMILAFMLVGGFAARRSMV